LSPYRVIYPFKTYFRLIFYNGLFPSSFQLKFCVNFSSHYPCSQQALAAQIIILTLVPLDPQVFYLAS